MKPGKIFVASAALAACSAFATPEVSNVTIEQTGNRTVTITYKLSEPTAVVTLDIQTNVTGTAEWVSIGGKYIQNFSPNSDVWKVVSGKSTYTIKWHPDLSWAGNKVTDGVRAVVTAWALDNTPDYMVCDIAESAQPNTQRYYPGEDFLPGGLLTNADYCKGKIVMRKIMAKNVEWRRGTILYKNGNNNDVSHLVTLTNNYYIGVFELTQGQYFALKGSRGNSYFSSAQCDIDLLPAENVSYSLARLSHEYASSDTQTKSYSWPNDPNPVSLCGWLRQRTGLDFDLPSESEWEYACRAGHGDGYWGDGSTCGDGSTANLSALARFASHDGRKDGMSYSAYVTSYGKDAMLAEVPDYFIARVGSFKPNDWGLYDMNGNVWELCHDWYVIAVEGIGGRTNINPENPLKPLTSDSELGYDYYRTIRGGGFDSPLAECRANRRGAQKTTDRYPYVGMRVTCRAGLK